MSPSLNLAALPTTTIAASVKHPTGRGARDPHVLLSNPPFDLDGKPLTDFIDYRPFTYDTYDGLNASDGLDWYALTFVQAERVNCVEMTMECPNRDGGWWTSLWVEWWDDERHTWVQANNLTITPPYNFADVPYSRRPYETHVLTFDRVTTRSLRLIGQAGGLAHFTSLSYIAVYNHDSTHRQPHIPPHPPMPYIFRLISADTIWDLSESLVKLTDLSVTVAYMDHYLDVSRYQRWWQRISHNYQGAPELWHLIGTTIGWDAWNTIENPPHYPNDPTKPFVRTTFNNTIARAVAPIVVDNQTLGEIASHLVILKQPIDERWHQQFAHEQGIAWHDYHAALQRSPQLSLEQLEGAATLMGMIANNMANLAHRNLQLERELVGARSGAEQRLRERRELVNKAVDLMQQHLETPITVAEVAQAIALSPTYFGIVFHEQMGCSPIDYLINLRIERAKTYLSSTTMSVMDVCVALGYNPSYFSRLFKQHTGMTPGQFARKSQHPST
jgi:AraC-like DNA-binding protein